MPSETDLAMVTGASSGIGVEFARVLAERKIDLVITARRVDRLRRLREELQEQHGVEVTVIPQDLGTPDGAEQLFAELERRDRPVTILVNNAGFGHYGNVVRADLADVQAAIQVNVTSLTTLTRLIAAGMKQRGHGYVLNVSSFAALQPIPRYAVYSGAKAYVVAFSQALRHELRNSGVKVSVTCPGFMATEFHDVARHRRTGLMRLLSLDPKRVARQSIAGMFKGKALVVPGWWYKLNALVVPLVPRSVASALSAVTVKDKNR